MEKAWDRWLDAYHRKPRGLSICSRSGVNFHLPPVSVNIHLLFQHNNNKTSSFKLRECGQERSLCTIRHGSEKV